MLELKESMWLQCSHCRVCAGSAFQSPPVLCAGNFSAPIIVIGQNPGVMDKDPVRMAKGQELLDREVMLTVSEMESFYQEDFGTSHGAKVLSRLFGEDWLTNGMFCFTNAVRCRIAANESPSEQMQVSCRSYTKDLIKGRKAIVLMGAIARKQVLQHDADLVPWGSLRQHPRFGYVFAIKHYAAWKGDESSYADTSKKLIRLVGEKS